MFARLAVGQFLSLLVAVLFAIAAPLVLGGVLGYTLKPIVRVPGRPHVLVIPEPTGANASSDACIWVSGHKHC